MNTTTTKPPLESFACCNPSCELVGQSGQQNLTIRKRYDRDNIRLLYCRSCLTHFSERRGTPLFNCRISTATAVSIAEHIGEGCGVKSTARLTRTHPETVRRLARKLGEHAQRFHDDQLQDVIVDSLQADERHGFVHDKKTPMWEAELLDPASRFVLAHAQGRRDSDLIRRLLSDGACRLMCRHAIVLFTDGLSPYATLFPEIFGEPYGRYRHSKRGRPGKPLYRIPRSLAHVQIVKHARSKRSRKRKDKDGIKIVYRHGTQKRVHAALDKLQHCTPNTALIERRNATARNMNAYQGRRKLGFARHTTTKLAFGWWTLTVYNWCREQRIQARPQRTALEPCKFIFRTPAMAIGLADRILTVEEIMFTPVVGRKGTESF